MYKRIFEQSITWKALVNKVPKKDLMIVLPYLGKYSLQIRTMITRVMKNKLAHSNFRILF